MPEHVNQYYPPEDRRCRVETTSQHGHASGPCNRHKAHECAYCNIPMCWAHAYPVRAIDDPAGAGRSGHVCPSCAFTLK